MLFFLNLWRKVFFFFFFLTVKLNSSWTDPFKWNVILNRENKISSVSCCILFYSCDWTEGENVNFIKISDGNWFFYELMTIELFINKDVGKTDEIFHDKCIFKCRKQNMRCIVLHPVLIVWLNWIRKCEFYQNFWRKWVLCNHVNWIVYK